ncbi:MAG: hypothetical protein Kow0083_05930 [Methylophaga sp.]
METLKILSGDFESVEWQINSKDLSRGFFITEKIPFSEIIEISADGVDEKNHYLLAKTISGRAFRASMSKSAYESFHKNFSAYGNQPNHLGLPVKEKNMLTIGGAIVFGLALIAGGNSSETSTPRITDSNARDLCASYIGEEFGRSASIISTEIIKRDRGVFVHAWYNRPMDNSRWDYVCNLDNDTIVWAAIDSGKVGRWRFEDEAKIYYSSDSDWYEIRY